MHLVGFTIEIYHDAWPYKHQICHTWLLVNYSQQSVHITGISNVAWSKNSGMHKAVWDSHIRYFALKPVFKLTKYYSSLDSWNYDLKKNKIK